MRQQAARRTRDRTTLGPAGVGLIIVIAAIVGTVVARSASSSVSSSSGAGSPGGHHPVPPSASASAGAPSLGDVRREGRTPATRHDGVVTEEDGVLPDGVTVFDDGYPGVARLDPSLLLALREAATDAADDRIELVVNSGWRSPDYQAQLLREAVSTYGSIEEAARWVATAETSPHVAGNAVDIGPVEAMAWLAKHGATYGLCRIYRNEPWHFELRPAAIHQGCPRMYADPTRDPRMQQ